MLEKLLHKNLNFLQLENVQIINKNIGCKKVLQVLILK